MNMSRNVLEYRTLAFLLDNNLPIPPQGMERFREVLLERVRSDERRFYFSHLNQTLLKQIPRHWSFNRLYFHPNGDFYYVAGQDYISEMREIRNHIYLSLKKLDKKYYGI